MRNAAVNDPSEIAHIVAVDSDREAKQEISSIAQCTIIPSNFYMPVKFLS